VTPVAINKIGVVGLIFEHSPRFIASSPQEGGIVGRQDRRRHYTKSAIRLQFEPGASTFKVK
jgi:hypothetical protein